MMFLGCCNCDILGRRLREQLVTDPGISLRVQRDFV